MDDPKDIMKEPMISFFVGDKRYGLDINNIKVVLVAVIAYIKILIDKLL